ncbi:MAG: family 10 glycosylhydrolase [Ignavibacterium sp.]
MYIKKIKIFILVILCSSMHAQTNEQFRATWLTNVDSYVLATDASIIEAVNYLSSIGVNVIFPVVYNKGYTLYPSTIMDSLFNAPTIPDPSFQNRDFLERLVIEAHRVGIEVIPWFEFGFSSSYSLNGGHIVARFPHWALKNNQGQLVVKNGFDWLSGVNPEVQNYMLSLVMEVIDKYDVDGVQGDDRLPAMPVEGGYDSVTVEIYKSEHSGNNPPNNPGDTNWKRWRADKLNQFFIRMRDSVKSRSEHLILSSSPTPFPWGYDEYLQDSKYWAQNNVVDNIIPQLYRYDFSGYQSVLSQSLSQIRSVNPSIYFAGVLIKSGSWVITPTLMTQIVNLNRSNNVNGECTFFYEGLRASNNEIGNLLGTNFYNSPALVPYRNGNIWRPKATIKNENETGVNITGNWTNYPMQGFTGQIIRTNQTTEYASVEYTVEVPFSANFDVYAYLTPNTTWTQQARYVIYSDTDSIEVIINQSNLNRKGWQKIGTAYLGEGTKTVMKIDNTYLESGRYLVADAMMIMINRKLSPDVIVTSVEEEEVRRENIPEGYVLEQNYPNPFNPSTKISWQSAVSSWQTIKVYDVIGNEVATLIDEYRESGKYEVEFDGSNLPSGVYFYQLRVGEFTQTKKMILLR